MLTEPQGLLSLATYLEHQFGDEVKIKILDLFALGYDQCILKNDLYVRGLSDENEILKHVEEFQPDIVGVTCNFSAYSQDTFEIVKLIKNAYSNVIIVLGGNHVTMEAPKVLEEHPYVDFIVRREGEVTFYELVKTLKNHPDYIHSI